jgi:prepilin-type N-terminal cleavage/methylation domain-containing protein
MKYHYKKHCALVNGFTLVEMSVAIVILGMIIATVFTVINRAIETVSEWQTKMEAFEIARDNMEKLLAQKSLSDKLEYGTSETNPDITWETTVESFYEPVSNQMWMRAVCVSEFKDSSGEDQKIELTHWLTSLTKKQIMQIMEQQQREQTYAETVGEDSSQNGENQNQNPENTQQ